MFQTLYMLIIQAGVQVRESAADRGLAGTGEAQPREIGDGQHDKAAGALTAAVGKPTRVVLGTRGRATLRVLPLPLPPPFFGIAASELLAHPPPPPPPPPDEEYAVAWDFPGPVRSRESDGRSGSFLVHSVDKRFIFKNIQGAEAAAILGKDSHFLKVSPVSANTQHHP